MSSSKQRIIKCGLHALFEKLKIVKCLRKKKYNYKTGCL